MKGEIWVYLNGELVEHGNNAIENTLRAYLETRITGSIDNGINDLFDADEEVFGGTEDGKDGMVVIDDAGNEYTLVTTAISPVNSNAKRWRGEITVSQARDMVSARLGYNFDSGSSPFFETSYATRTFSSVHNMEAEGVLVIEWEVQIT